MDWPSFISYYEAKNTSPAFIPVLKKTKLVESTNEECVVLCENNGAKMLLNTRLSEIEKSLAEFTNKKLRLIFIPKEKKQRKESVPLPLIEFYGAKEDIIKKADLQSRFTFENFAVSPSNHIAHAAARAVADKPGHAYNPLFLYGDVGVGKTHLSQAVAHRILDGDVKKKVLFCSSEQFTNDLVECIREKNTQQLRKKYRSLDVLIIDDVQFIAGKNYVQEEFYHTFNTIVQKGGQIILTSDRPPKEIKELENRLSSRFSGGLIIDIQKPDFELRTAILLIKAQERKIDIDMNAAQRIAEKIKDTRELEGALLKLLTISLSSDSASNKISIETTERELKKRENSILNKTSPQDVIRAIASYYDIKPSNIRGESRKAEFVRGRQVVMYILRNIMKLKLEDIAYILKRKDHTTVIHGAGKISTQRLRDNSFRQEVDGIIESLGLST
ncbi:chromosomal replication initiator protein DnaA [Candidatus Roizmanbacteria bacterium RIFCSPLOWO2_02_FULL_37_19]|nr:MAG: chromosomal replication initiator protein DnaA [Candidatus Roizmanbacteria bacterium RIFCSPHIGHO2_12_FULL_37_23]OGK53724.1 MAG: chromosomal replication initiator protein DnaA [Candidatus Roizmanbacteria bacterium RIFCSPLOWO2_02_FULL_37_19]OGK59482.1 MAG: chromosomal replication initiator protein DnaA [Candidatus Roizmanbacteria bacterium RIFCSPLOWO2_12_FULL_37_7b]